MICERIEAQLSEHGAQVLKDDREAQAHIAECPRCYGFLEALGSVDRELRALPVEDAPDAIVAMKVLGAMGMASRTVERLGIDLFTGKASMLVTNVPGPTHRVRLFGGTLGGLMVWAPVSGSVGLGITLVSYAGSVRMGVGADVHRLGAPEALVTAFEADLDAIARAAGV